MRTPCLRLLAAVSLAALALVPTESRAVDVPVVSNATYFRPDRIESPPGTSPVALAPLGITPGMVLDVRSVGDWNNGPGGDIYSPMMVLFSSSSTLLDRFQRYRVPGALGVGRNNITLITCPSSDSLDVPQDFLVDQDTTIVTVPAGAAYVFVSTADCYWIDNTDPDHDLKLRLTPLGFADVPVSLAADAAMLASPNPFTRTTTVRFALAREGDARLSVYDVTGRLRRTLARGLQTAGIHTALFDGLDDERRVLPRGTYFVRITDSAGSRTLKVTRLP